MCSEGEKDEEWLRLLRRNCENFHVKVLLISVALSLLSLEISEPKQQLYVMKISPDPL